jgi:hypothetical protein
MTSSDQNSPKNNIRNGAVASVADFIDRSRASRNYLEAAGLPLSLRVLAVNADTAPGLSLPSRLIVTPQLE